jgi:hypothetical protein
VSAEARHCPDCRRRFSARHDLCPDCWTRLVDGPVPSRDRLTLVYETVAFYEADLLESLLRDEGIPCLRVPAPGALPWSLAGVPALAGLRLYVPADLGPVAAALIAEVTGGGLPESRAEPVPDPDPTTRPPGRTDPPPERP